MEDCDGGLWKRCHVKELLQDNRHALARLSYKKCRGPIVVAEIVSSSLKDYYNNMGRSQVERNRIKGRPGRGGRGRGGGSSSGGGRGGGGGRSSSNNKRRSGPDPRTLGDNAFRFERRNKDTSNNDDGSSSDMLLDDFNTGLLLGSDYYGASHYDLQEDDYNNEGGTTTSFENSSDNDWMSVDVQALTACLKQLPIHERLDVPYHVGKHIESRYGIDNAATAGGKKTLAELREESKCIVNNDVDYGITNSADDLPTVEEVDTNTNQNSSETEEAKADNSGGDEDDEDDLDAWLDDMIS